MILPLHRELDAIRENANAALSIGTTRRGIGPAYEDKVGRRAIRLMDLADGATLDRKIERLLTHHNALRKGLGLEPIEAAAVHQELTSVAPAVLPFMDSVWSLLEQKRREGKRILFEGAQGALLDVDHGTYPYVTSSNTVAAQASIGSGMGPRRSAMCSASVKPIRPASAPGHSRPSRKTTSAACWASVARNSAW